MRPDRGLERIRRRPATRRRGRAAPPPSNIGRGHGIGCPKQSPTPVASRALVDDHDHLPAGQQRSGDDVPVRRGRRDVDASSSTPCRRPPRWRPGLDLPIDLRVAVSGQEGGGVGRGHALHRGAGERLTWVLDPGYPSAIRVMTAAPAAAVATSARTRSGAIAIGHGETPPAPRRGKAGGGAMPGARASRARAEPASSDRDRCASIVVTLGQPAGQSSPPFDLYNTAAGRIHAHHRRRTGRRP